MTERMMGEHKGKYWLNDYRRQLSGEWVWVCPHCQREGSWDGLEFYFYGSWIQVEDGYADDLSCRSCLVGVGRE